jgi:phosphomannomutase
MAERILAFPCSGEINFTVADVRQTQDRIARHYMRANPMVETLDGIGMEFSDWRFNLRASNTEPLLRLNVEARGDRRLLEEKIDELSRLIRG